MGVDLHTFVFITKEGELCLADDLIDNFKYPFNERDIARDKFLGYRGNSYGLTPRPWPEYVEERVDTQHADALYYQTCCTLSDLIHLRYYSNNPSPPEPLKSDYHRSLGYLSGCCIDLGVFPSQMLLLFGWDGL